MKKKKTIHELAKQFPLKTYRELEKYRDADRWEEAIGIGHNHPPKDDVTKDDLILLNPAKMKSLSIHQLVPAQYKNPF